MSPHWISSCMYSCYDTDHVNMLNFHSSEFEQNIPFYLRCRAALLATPSRYPQLETAIEASPEPSRRSLAISFQV